MTLRITPTAVNLCTTGLVFAHSFYLFDWWWCCAPKTFERICSGWRSWSIVFVGATIIYSCKVTSVILNWQKAMLIPMKTDASCKRSKIFATNTLSLYSEFHGYDWQSSEEISPRLRIARCRNETLNNDQVLIVNSFRPLVRGWLRYMAGWRDTCHFAKCDNGIWHILSLLVRSGAVTMQNKSVELCIK